MSVKIHEVGLRDGLQIEKRSVPLEIKIEWINHLIEAGIKIIQVGSFVSPKAVPQMADTIQLFKHFAQEGNKPADVVLSGLMFNERGLEDALKSGVGLFCMGVSASDTHSMKNVGKNSAEAQVRIINMAKEAIRAGKTVQASVQSAFGCGFEGPIPAEKVIAIIGRYLEAGITNISLADTAGHAYPQLVQRLFYSIGEAYQEMDIEKGKLISLTCHFHNTYGLGLANCFAAIDAGVIYLESAFGGLGGCPFTKLAAGNVCTEDLVHSLQRAGFCRNISLDKLIALAKKVEVFFGRELPGFVMKSGSIVNFKRKDS